MNKSIHFIFGVVTLISIVVMNNAFAEDILKKTWHDTPLRGIAVSFYDGVPGMGFDVDGYITEECFEKMKNWNVNVVRFMVSLDPNSIWYGTEADGDTLEPLGSNPLEPYLENLTGLAKAVEYAEKYKIHYIIYVGSTYARGFPTDHYDEFKSNFALLWEHLARQYGNRKYLLGYVLQDEPSYVRETAETLDYTLPKMLIEKIRAIDQETYITLMPGHSGLNTNYAVFNPLPATHNYKVRYIAHMFAPRTFTHQGLDAAYPVPNYYPGNNWDPANFVGGYGNFYQSGIPFLWNKTVLRSYLQAARDFELDNNLDPILIGSFCAIRWAPSTDLVNWVKDLCSIYDEYGWGHIWHAFGEWGGWNPTWPLDTSARPRAFDGGYETALFTELKTQWQKNTLYEVYETLGEWNMDGNVNDSSLSWNDLTANGCTYDNVDFKEGSHSINFNGSSDYLQTSGNVSIDNQFTISGWIKVTDQNGTKSIVGNGGPVPQGDGFMLCIYNGASGNGKLIFDTSNGTIHSSADTDIGAISLNQWHYVACVVDRQNGSAEIYVDGVDKTLHSSILTDFNINKTIYVGKPLIWGEYFQGKIDDLKIVERLYSAEEIGSLGYWKFDGDTNDSSLHWNDLSLHGATYDFDAKSGSSLRLNGTSDYLQTVSPMTINNQFTISGWIKVTDQNGTKSVIGNGGPVPQGDGFMLCIYNGASGNGKLIFDTSNGTIHSSADTDIGAISLNQWHYVACVVDQQNGSAEIYVDGVDKTLHSSILTDFNINKTIYIGKPLIWGEYFQGSIDDFKITDHLLNQSEITAESAKYKVLASWEFDENSNDSSFSGRDLIAHSCTYDLSDFEYGIASIVLDGSKSYLQPYEATPLPEQFTIMGWIKATNQDDTKSIVGNGGPVPQGDGFMLCIYNGAGGNGQLIFDTSNGTTRNSASTALGVISLNQWHHVACVVDRVNGIASIYVDGEDETVDSSIQTDFNISKNIYIGKPLIFGEYFQGKIDNLKIVAKLLNQAEIQADM